MSEVKVELEEEEHGPWPQPVLVIQAAPPAFLAAPGPPRLCWTSWLQTFQRYLAALGETHLADSSKCLLLRSCLGGEGRRVLSSLAGGDASYAAAVSALTDYFTCDAAAQAQVLRFYQRSQVPGESAQQFVLALEQLAGTWTSSQAPEQRVLRQMVAGTRCPQLKEKLLQQREALTLPAALLLAQDLESGPDPPRTRKARRGRPARVGATEEPGMDGGAPEDLLEEDPGVGDPPCPLCQRRVTRGDSVEHPVSTHAKEKASACQSDHMARHVCVGATALQTHKEALLCEAEAESGGPAGREAEPGPAGTKRHSCPVCVDRHFTGANKLSRHMRTHTKEKPFSCPVCFLKFSQSYHMTRHLKKQHHSLPVCPECGGSFGSWQQLKTHRKSHGGPSCSSCGQQFQLKSQLLSHLRSHRSAASGPQSLTCADCGKVFGRLYHLKRHILSHRKAADGERHDCLTCKRSFAFPEDLQKHVRVHVQESNGTCPKCKLTFGSQEELERHMQAHRQAHACRVCARSFKVEYALRKHMQVHVDEPFFCRLCSKRFLKRSHYKRHQLVHQRRELRCPHCPAVFLRAGALKGHLRTHLAERPHHCPCCPESFQQSEELERHRLRHRRIKAQLPYSCTRCDRAFAALGQLTQHMAQHQRDEPMSCPDCGKTFLNKGKLERHRSVHSGRRPHLCSLCGDGFPSAAGLQLHLRIHTGEKPFRCSRCDKSFKSASGLRLHGRRHMEAPPSFACLQCGRTYGRRTELKMHQRYHTGDRPFACSCCAKRFVSKNKLVVHMRSHTGERPYACAHCGATFTQTGDRNRHVHKYHAAPP
ncbi:zinc finger protein 345-like [Synchiropus splendidus]|uniref:zinc finger protein 345-like n=1 Tax=Synchiropus splendidus TaxID=270530 RepID=UPI00237DFF23|nr:zinc finger protein 345-like [Synchiropus splendidus]